MARAGGVHRWVLEQPPAGRGLSTVQLRLHALVLAKEMNINDFAGGPSWWMQVSSVVRTGLGSN